MADSSKGEALMRPDPAARKLAFKNALQTGEYVSVVTLGAFKTIKVDASYGAIRPGDVLTPSPNPGCAMRADGAEAGTVIGKALKAFDSGQGAIPVFVSLH